MFMYYVTGRLLENLIERKNTERGLWPLYYFWILTYWRRSSQAGELTYSKMLTEHTVKEGDNKFYKQFAEEPYGLFGNNEIIWNDGNGAN